MKRGLPFVTAALLLCLFQTSRAGGSQNQKGSLQGVVLRGSTDAPAVGVRVSVYVGAGDAIDYPIRTTTTDRDGVFKVTALDPGPYSLRFSREGYAESILGERHTNRGTFVGIVTVAAGQTTNNIVMHLALTGSVSGTVRTSTGEPAVGISVRLSRSSYGDDGEIMWMDANSANTDDRGEYRIFGVEAGHYYAFAGGDSRRIIKGNESVEPYSISYYPGVVDMARAGAIDLAPGGNIERIDFTLRPPQLYQVRGRIIEAATNAPPPSPQISTSRDRFGVNPQYDPRTGDFVIGGLAPGEFKVSAWIPGAACGVTGFVAEQLSTTDSDGVSSIAGAAGTTAVRLGESDVYDVLIVIRKLGCLKGSVATEGKRLPHWFPLQLRKNDEKQHRTIASMTDDGQFKVEGLQFGKYDLLPLRLPDGFYLKAATYGGADVLNRPFEFESGGTSKLEILLSTRVAHVEGAVTTPAGKAASGVIVALVPASRDRYDLYLTEQTDERGKFVFNELNPGDYTAFAWESIEENAWMNADFLSRYKQFGRPVHLEEESKEILNLQVIPMDRAN